MMPNLLVVTKDLVFQAVKEIKEVSEAARVFVSKSGCVEANVVVKDPAEGKTERSEELCKRSLVLLSLPESTNRLCEPAVMIVRQFLMPLMLTRCLLKFSARMFLGPVAAGQLNLFSATYMMLGKLWVTRTN